MASKAGSIDKAGAYVFRFKPRITLQNGRGIIAGSKHVQDVFDGQAPPTDDGLAAEQSRIAGNPIKERFFSHGRNLLQGCAEGKGGCRCAARCFSVCRWPCGFAAAPDE